MSPFSDEERRRLGARSTTPLPPILVREASSVDTRRSSRASSSGRSRSGSIQKARPESAQKLHIESTRKAHASPAFGSSRATSQSKDRSWDENSTGAFAVGARFAEDEAREILGLADNRVNAGRVKGLTQMVPFPPDSQSKSERSTPRKHRHSSGSEPSQEGESVQKRSLSFLNLNDQSFRNLAQQIADEIIVRGPKETSSWGSVKESTGGGASVSSQPREQGALLSTAKSTVTAGAVTAGVPRRRLQEALQEAGLRSLAEKLSLEAARHPSTGPPSAATAAQESASRPSSARSRRSRDGSPNGDEVMKGGKQMLEGKLGAPEMTRADLEQELQAERERREAEVAAVRKEAAERAKKLQRHVRKAEVSFEVVLLLVAQSLMVCIQETHCILSLSVAGNLPGFQSWCPDAVFQPHAWTESCLQGSISNIDDILSKSFYLLALDPMMGHLD